MSDQNPKTVDATVHSFQILHELVESDRPMGVTELADSVGLSKGVVYNHLGTLSQLGYVRKKDTRYSPSLQLLRLGEQTRTRYEAFTTARPRVDNLAKTTGEVATLFVEEDGRGICLHMAVGSNDWTPKYVCGEPLPLHAIAPGKAILASLQSDRVDEIVDQHGLPSLTDQTITDENALRSSIRNVQESDIAFSREEQSEGIIGVGTSFGLEKRAPTAAIGVCGPLDRLSGRYLKEDITGQMISTAKSIQVELTS